MPGTSSVNDQILRVVLPSLLPLSSDEDSASEDSSADDSDADDSDADGVEASSFELELPQAVIDAMRANAESADKTFFILKTSININLVCFGIPCILCRGYLYRYSVLPRKKALGSKIEYNVVYDRLEEFLSAAGNRVCNLAFFESILLKSSHISLA